MTELSSLLLPILLSAVFVFIASSIIHMATPWHAGDYKRVPNEDAVAASLRAHAVPAGDYMMPRPSSMKEMGSPEFLEKRRQGPVMIFTMMPSGEMSMTSNLVQWFVYLLVVGLFTAYVTGLALGPWRSWATGWLWRSSRSGTGGTGGPRCGRWRMRCSTG